MKIYQWLNNSYSAINGIAIVEVEPNETPPCEDFLKIVDGDNVGHFGYSICLLSLDKPPKIKIVKGIRDVESDFGFPNASTIIKHKRYYKVFVHRD